ncbi:MAG TPA: hypothetical protein VMM55_13410 [Thermohalobaculum sp.]|nr:hypothetical protein [Thermohalobaculum sp.]
MNAEPETRDDLLVQLEIEKRRLECEKLRAEIEETRQPFWKRPGYVASLSPLVIAGLAFFSAWITGYFDAERRELDAEVKELTARRAALTAEIDEMQAGIDRAYLALKAALAEARYAVGHFAAVTESGRDPADLLSLAEDADPALAERLRAEVEATREDRRLVRDILDISTDDLARVEQSLDTLPASDWARALTYEIGPDSHLLRAPDGRLYDLREQRFLTEDEAEAAGQPGQPGQ